ncbi:hypothetical protein LOZ53_004563 [Ophidiomyces ophidiicola]|nr:hypothetical protein LOZ53_004563 [Ophidiomyces ophidiicola]
MIGLQSDTGHLARYGPSESRDDTSAGYFSKLPRDAPDVIIKSTVAVKDPTRIFLRHREERQRNFYLLVRKYKRQLLYGCQTPDCNTPTCCSYRKRTSTAPFRNYTDLTARTLACYLSSQSNPENGLCPNLVEADSECFTHKNARLTTGPHFVSKSIVSPGNDHHRNSSSLPTRCSTVENHENPSSPLIEPTQSKGYLDQPYGKIPRPKGRKDPRSISQNLFDTLPVRMMECLPMKKAARTCERGSPEWKEQNVPHKSRHDRSYELNIRRGNKPPKSNEPCSTIYSCSRIGMDTSTSTPISAVISPLRSAKGGHGKPFLGTNSNDNPTIDQKPTFTVASKISQMVSPLSISSPLPTQPEYEDVVLERDIKKQPKNKENPLKLAFPAQLDNKPTYQFYDTDDVLLPRNPTCLSTAPNNTEKVLNNSSPGHGLESQVESLSTLSNDIIDCLEEMMFDTGEDEQDWKDEMYLMETRGYAEPWKWQFATPIQRQIFPFITQSLFFVLSSPSQLLHSFNPFRKPRLGDSNTSASYIDTQGMDVLFRKLHRLCPWEVILTSLWVCLEKLFVPSKEFSSSSKDQRRFVWHSSTFSQSKHTSNATHSQNHIPDSDAIFITGVTLFALTSSIPALEPHVWQEFRQARSAGIILPDREIRKHSDATKSLLTEATDKFGHDLALRLMCRLVRVISARHAIYEISKLRSSCIQNANKPEQLSPLDLIITYMTPCISSSYEPLLSTGPCNDDRQITIPMLAVEWLKSVLSKEWDGEPELTKSSAAGSALQLLSFMYENKTRLCLVPEDFHVLFLFDRMDPLEMPSQWLGFTPNNRTIHILSCSFMFHPSSLVTYFRSLNLSTMSKSFGSAAATSQHIHRTVISGRAMNDAAFDLGGRMRASISKFLVLVIRRDNLLVDAFDQLWRREKQEIMRPLRVQMGLDYGEEGVDHGGVQQEFFRLALAEVLDPKYGMFSFNSENNTSWFRVCSFEMLYKFELVGILVSLAIYNGLTLPLNFPIALYMKLLDQKVTALDHIRNGWESLARGLDQMLLWNDGDVGEIFMRTYEFSYDLYGKVVSVDMAKVGRNDPWPPTERNVKWDMMEPKSYANPPDITHGEASGSSDVEMLALDIRGDLRSANRREGHISGILKGSSSKPRERCAPSPQPEDAPLVTNFNRQQFVTDYIFWLTDKSVRPQYEAFARGFYTCLDRTALSVFSPEALKRVIEGFQEINIDKLQEHVVYEGFDPNQKFIQDFWEIVQGYCQKKKSLLLEFVTASDRVPVSGISSITFIITRNGDNDAYLPTSSTCFGKLYLQEYSSRAVLEERLEKALENTKGFGSA